MFIIVGPLLRVGGNVCPDALQRGFIANDVFIVIALPDGRARRVAQGVDAFGGDGFELADNGADGTGLRPARG